MAEKLTVVIRTWLHTCFTKTSSTLFQSSSSASFHPSVQLWSTICGCTSFTMWFLQPYPWFGSLYLTGSTTNSISWIIIAPTESDLMMFTSQVVSFGAGSSMLAGKVFSLQRSALLRWMMLKNKMGRLEVLRLMEISCFVQLLSLSMSMCSFSRTSIPSGPGSSFLVLFWVSS